MEGLGDTGFNFEELFGIQFPKEEPVDGDSSDSSASHGVSVSALQQQPDSNVVDSHVVTVTTVPIITSASTTTATITFVPTTTGFVELPSAVSAMTVASSTTNSVRHDSGSPGKCQT